MSLISDLTGIADAIREKTGKTDKMLLADMPGEIAGISGGGNMTATVFIGGCPKTQDNAYQSFSNQNYVNSHALNFSDASKPTCLRTGTYSFFGEMSEQSGQWSPNKSTLIFRINGKDIETFTVPNHSNGGKLNFDFETKLNAGDWFGFFKDGTDGWSTVTTLTIESKGIKIPTHYFLYIQPDYTGVPEVAYVGPTITTTNPTEV